jgi:hypothetical protein
MHVRRFFCKKSTCAQKIFVEDFPISAVLTRNAPNGCKKRFAIWASRWEAREVLMWEVSTVSTEVVTRSCVWFTNRNRLPGQSHASSA